VNQNERREISGIRNINRVNRSIFNN